MRENIPEMKTKPNHSLMARRIKAVAEAWQKAGYASRAEAEAAGMNLKAIWEATK